MHIRPNKPMSHSRYGAIIEKKVNKHTEELNVGTEIPLETG